MQEKVKNICVYHKFCVPLHRFFEIKQKFYIVT